MDIVTPATKWAALDGTPVEESALSAPPNAIPVEEHVVEKLSKTQKVIVFLGVVVPFIGLIASFPILWGWGVGWVDVALLLAFYSMSVLGVTVGFHRLFTHKSFETVKPLRWLLAIWGSMSLQGPVIKWCAVHRRHHQCSDHDGDPHSPHLHGEGLLGMIAGMWHAHVGWVFQGDPHEINRSVKDLLADKVLVWIDSMFFLWVFSGVAIPGLIGGLITGTWAGVFTGVLWGGLVRICVMHHVTWSINSVCHVFGTKAFRSGDHSTNNLPIAIVSFGEGWHNNHHAFPTSARHGLRWWQLDITWIFIWTLKKLGLAWNVRVPTPEQQAAKAIALPKPETPAHA